MAGNRNAFATAVLPESTFSFIIEWQVKVTKAETEIVLAAGGIKLRHMTVGYGHDPALRTIRVDNSHCHP